MRDVTERPVPELRGWNRSYPSYLLAAAVKSAARIGSSPQAEQMCAHMGAGAPGFAETGMVFHRTADRITEATERRDLDASLHAVSETPSTCTSCHREFRQEIVAENESGHMTHPPSDGRLEILA